MNRQTAISARQIKAARALLDWSQEELAQASGLSIATIRKIESGAMSPRDKTMGAIISSLEENNIEFTDPTGVRIKDQSVVIIEGKDCYARLLDEIFYSINNKGREVLFMNGDPTRLNEAELAGHIRLRAAGIKHRILIEECNTDICFPLPEFRWIPSKYFRYNLMVVFQNRVALCIYEKTTQRKDMDKIYIFENEPLAETMRSSFNFMWDNCRKPTVTTASQVYK